MRRSTVGRIFLPTCNGVDKQHSSQYVSGSRFLGTKASVRYFLTSTVWMPTLAAPLRAVLLPTLMVQGVSCIHE